MNWFVAFLMSKGSGYLAIFTLAAATYIGYQFYECKLQGATCEGKESVRPQIEALTDRVVERISEEEDEKLEAVLQAANECLDARMPSAVVDSLRDD